MVLARVERHDWTYRNGVKISGTFRGITLYEVLSDAIAIGGSAIATTVDGIDVSHYQGTIDWRKVVDGGKVFAFMKATEGSGSVDAAFADNWSSSRTAGLLRGAYHFYRPGQDAIAQAKLFLSRIDAPGELPAVLDVEQANGTPVHEIAAGVSAWIDYVAASYGRPLVYTSPSFWRSLPPIGIEGKADLWAAKWSDVPPGALGGWDNWSFWQYSEKGAVPGIAGAVDLDRFNGSLDDLHAYVTRGGDGTSPEVPTFELTTARGVQQALNYLGATPQLGVDGIAGARTRAAIEAFQRAHGLGADGIVGPRTIAALRAALERSVGTFEERRLVS